MPDGICPFTEWKPVEPYGAGGIDKVGFCDHTAAGYFTTLSNPDFWNQAGYSVHFAAGLKGEGVQLVNIFDRAWGQGVLQGVTWPPFADMSYSNPNNYLISVEHEDAINVNGKTQFTGSVWTPEMYAMDLRIKQWCIEEFQRVKGVSIMPFGLDSLAGHYMFNGETRANCPGKPWENEYRKRLYNDLTREDDMYHKQDVWPAFLNKREINGRQHVNTAIDFQWPIGTKYGLIEFFVLKGYFVVHHGDGSTAADVGWGTTFEGKAYSRDVLVEPASDGSIWLEGTAQLQGARGKAYWT